MGPKRYPRAAPNRMAPKSRATGAIRTAEVAHSTATAAAVGAKEVQIAENTDQLHHLHVCVSIKCAFHRVENQVFVLLTY